MKLANVERFVRGRKVALLGSVDENGMPNIKAMLAPSHMIGLREFYFSTNLSAMRTQQYLKNPKACIYFFRKGWLRYVGVMLRGKMEVVTEQEVKNLLWRKGDVRFYKYGVTDSDYCVLKFTAESGRYYQDLKTEDFEIK